MQNLTKIQTLYSLSVVKTFDVATYYTHHQELSMNRNPNYAKIEHEKELEKIKKFFYHIFIINILILFQNVFTIL